MYEICIFPTKFGLKFIQMSYLVGLPCSNLKRLKSLEITHVRAGGLSSPWEMVWIVSNPQRTPANTCTRTTFLLLEVRQWVLAQERAGRAMWTQRTGGRLWNCSLSKKNKRPAVGAHRCEGGKRQLEESLVYRSANSKSTPYYPHTYVWPCDPKTAPPPSTITTIPTCVKVIIWSSGSAAFPLFSHRSQKIYNCLPSYCSFLAAAQSNQKRRHIFIYCLRQAELFFFFLHLSSSNDGSMSPELQKHSNHLVFESVLMPETAACLACGFSLWSLFKLIKKGVLLLKRFGVSRCTLSICITVSVYYPTCILCLQREYVRVASRTEFCRFTFEFFCTSILTFILDEQRKTINSIWHSQKKRDKSSLRIYAKHCLLFRSVQDKWRQTSKLEESRIQLLIFKTPFVIQFVRRKEGWVTVG